MIYFAEYIIISAGCTLMLKKVFEYSNLFLFFLFFACFSFAMMMLCYLITSFFSKAKTAGLLGILIIFITYVPSILCKLFLFCYPTHISQYKATTLAR